jgi:hypothetical protein
MSETKISPFVARVAENLEEQQLATLLMLTSVVLENARQFFASLGGGTMAAEIDAVYKPFVDELMRRSIELEEAKPVMPVRREGNA